MGSCLIFPGLAGAGGVPSKIRDKLNEIAATFKRGGNTINAVSGKNATAMNTLFALSSGAELFTLYYYLHALMQRLTSPAVLDRIIQTRMERLNQSKANFSTAAGKPAGGGEAIDAE